MNATSYSLSFRWLLGLLVTMFVTGCGSSDGGSGGGAQLGSVAVSLTDAPACGFDEVNITVERVRVHQSSSASENAAGWTTTRSRSGLAFASSMAFLREPSPVSSVVVTVKTAEGAVGKVAVAPRAVMGVSPGTTALPSYLMFPSWVCRTTRVCPIIT